MSIISYYLDHLTLCIMYLHTQNYLQSFLREFSSFLQHFQFLLWRLQDVVCPATLLLSGSWLGWMMILLLSIPCHLTRTLCLLGQVLSLFLTLRLIQRPRGPGTLPGMCVASCWNIYNYLGCFRNYLSMNFFLHSQNIFINCGESLRHFLCYRRLCTIILRVINSGHVLVSTNHSQVIIFVTCLRGHNIGVQLKAGYEDLCTNPILNDNHTMTKNLQNDY